MNKHFAQDLRMVVMVNNKIKCSWNMTLPILDISFIEALETLIAESFYIENVKYGDILVFVKEPNDKNNIQT